MQHILSYSIIPILLVTTLLVPFVLVRSMESTSYRIEFDSVNSAGNESSSDSYQLGDTLGESAIGDATSAAYALGAGYRQMDTVYLALTPAADVVLSPALGGISGGESGGITYATATTDSLGGYELSLKASGAPALVGETSGATIADYAPGADPSYTFSYGAAEALFAFTPEGADVASRYKNSGSTCATGSSDDASRCWDGLSTSDRVVSQRTSANHPLGTQTALRFAVGIGGAVNQTADNYTATTTITLVAL